MVGSEKEMNLLFALWDAVKQPINFIFEKSSEENTKQNVVFFEFMRVIIYWRK